MRNVEPPAGTGVSSRIDREPPREEGFPVLYTIRRPVVWGHYVHLFPSATAARTAAEAGDAVLAVAVRFDAPARRITPLWTDADRFDPAWSAPAELYPDGSVVARGPVPGPLFVV